jgi:hypothetical protein
MTQPTASSSLERTYCEYQESSEGTYTRTVFGEKPYNHVYFPYRDELLEIVNKSSTYSGSFVLLQVPKQPAGKLTAPAG